MRVKILAGTAMLLATVSAHGADVKLPKAFLGEWCAETPVTGGGGPGFWFYSHSYCNDPAGIHRDRDMTIGPNVVNGCKVIKITRNRDKVYSVSFRCKDGDNKAEMWLELDGLGFRDVDNPPYQAHP
jgi:hypothetical protein